MTNHNVITHQLDRQILEPHFFILNKGNNSGKPLKESCPNCFVVTVKTTEEAENLYWIAHTLWQANYWKPPLIGSVILFIRINIFKNLFRDAVLRAYKQNLRHLDFVNRIKQLESLSSHYKSTVDTIEKLKWALLQNQLR